MGGQKVRRSARCRFGNGVTFVWYTEARVYTEGCLSTGCWCGGIFGGSDRNRMKWVGHVTRTGYTYKILFGKSERKGPLGSHTRRWEYNIKVGPTEVV